jgi:hypothetical protein
MFEILFKYPVVIARYRAAPHADSCADFLRVCADHGYFTAMLRKIAWVLLAVAPGINIDAAEISLHDIELAVDQRTKFARRSGHAVGFWSRDLEIGDLGLRPLVAKLAGNIQPCAGAFDD